MFCSSSRACLSIRCPITAPAAPPTTAPMMAPRAVEPVALPITAPTAPPEAAPMMASFFSLLHEEHPATPDTTRSAASAARSTNACPLICMGPSLLGFLTPIPCYRTGHGPCHNAFLSPDGQGLLFSPLHERLPCPAPAPEMGARRVASRRDPARRPHRGVAPLRRVGSLRGAAPARRAHLAPGRRGLAAGHVFLHRRDPEARTEPLRHEDPDALARPPGAGEALHRSGGSHGRNRGNRAHHPRPGAAQGPRRGLDGGGGGEPARVLSRVRGVRIAVHRDPLVP